MTNIEKNNESLAVTSPVNQVVNIAAYKFVTIKSLEELRTELRKFCENLDLKGTILLSEEGINIFVAGERESIDELLKFLRENPLFENLEAKESLSDYQPFNRMLVKIKNEIIAFGIEGIEPEKQTSPRVSAKDLKAWLDAGKDVTLLDVRNDYEIEIGTFEKAVPIGLDNFRDFPEAVEKLPTAMKEKPVVTFCTGGIRCEKAGPFLEKAGFKNIYQLDGGILKYFEECGGTHYDGECFVFDKRVAVDADLAETDKEMCFVCQAILTPEEYNSSQYSYGEYCPYCYAENFEKTIDILQQRHLAIERITNPLPGKGPYLNRRPVRVIKKFDGAAAIDFVTSVTSRLSREDWIAYFEADQITRKGEPISANEIVKSGDRLIHLMPDTVEPDVNVNIRILHEDDSIIVVNKPAPLPMHPCGRFNRNSLEYILGKVYTPLELRQVHRLDANTTGIVVLSKTKEVARWLTQEFKQFSFEKSYLARVSGDLPSSEFECDEPISNEKSRGGARKTSDLGVPAKTLFKHLTTFSDGTHLLEALPKTGRTNQIRIHLNSLNLPIVGDPVYRSAKTESDRMESSELLSLPTLSVSDPPMCLHAWRVSFRHPEAVSGVQYDRVEFESKKPDWSEE